MFKISLPADQRGRKGRRSNEKGGEHNPCISAPWVANFTNLYLQTIIIGGKIVRIPDSNSGLLSPMSMVDDFYYFRMLQILAMRVGVMK